MTFGPQYIKLAEPGSEGGEKSAPRRVSVFFNSTANTIPDGSCVSVDTSDVSFGKGASMQPSNGTADAFNVLGISDRDVAPGEWGPVVTYGVKVGCLTAGLIVDEAAAVSSTTAGKVWGAGVGVGDADHNYVGFALGSSYATDSLVDLFIILG